jgi:hypothetical protein
LATVDLLERVADARGLFRRQVQRREILIFAIVLRRVGQRLGVHGRHRTTFLARRRPGYGASPLGPRAPID